MPPEAVGDLFRTATADLSDDGVYRFSLTRTWEGGVGRVLWIMLNPSTGDADSDDPTIRRCISFSRAWGFAELEVVNLFAYRATDPHALDGLGEHRAIGAGNNQAIALAARRASAVLCAWGAHPIIRRWRRDETVLLFLHLAGRTAECLGTTAGGYPRHPLYVRSVTQRQPFGGGGGDAT